MSEYDFTLASFNVDDLKEELEHSQLLYVALCPYSAKSVIAQTVVAALTATLESEHLGAPCSLYRVDPFTATAEEDAYVYKKWKLILKTIVRGFKAPYLPHTDAIGEYHLRERQYTQALALFIEHFEDLWI